MAKPRMTKAGHPLIKPLPKGKGVNLRVGGGNFGLSQGLGLPPPPDGFRYVVDGDGKYVVDLDGNYVIAAI